MSSGPKTCADVDEAMLEARRYIEDLASGLIKPVRGEIVEEPLADGGVVSLFYSGSLVAQAVVVRDLGGGFVLATRDFRVPFGRGR